MLHSGSNLHNWQNLTMPVPPDSAILPAHIPRCIQAMLHMCLQAVHLVLALLCVHARAGIDKACAKLVFGLSQLALVDECKARQRAATLPVLSFLEVSAKAARCLKQC